MGNSNSSVQPSSVFPVSTDSQRDLQENITEQPDRCEFQCFDKPQYYRYTRLKDHSNQIRLLSLAQLNASSETPARSPLSEPQAYQKQKLCLKRYELSKAKNKYYAVSYCWQSEETGKYQLDIWNEKGQHRGYIWVSHNVHEALRYLFAWDGQAKIWIGQVCINQNSTYGSSASALESVNEKTAQVQIMDQVYSSAFEVVVWLADKRRLPTTNPTVAFAHESSKYTIRYPSLKTCGASDVAIFDRDANWDNIRTFADHERLLRGITILSSVLRHNWFERTWVIQELCYGQRVKVVFGSLKMEWETLVELIANATKLFDLEEAKMHFQDGDGTLKAILDVLHEVQHKIEIYNRTRDSVQDGIRQSLEENLVNFSRNKATDSRDKINAVLRISKELKTRKIVPNNKSSIKEIFTDAMLSMLSEEEGLDLLACSGRSQATTEGLPSWVPDFSTEFTRRGIWNSFKTYKACGPVNFHPFQKSLPTRRTSKSTSSIQYTENSAIKLLGYFVDDIDRYMPLNLFFGTINEKGSTVSLRRHLNTLLTCINEERAKASRWHYETEDISEILWRVIVGNEERGDTGDARRPKYPPEIFNRLLTQEHIEIDSRGFEDMFEDGTRRLSLILSEGTLFWTSQETYIGMSLEPVQENDRVCIFSRCRTPFILRRIGQRTQSSASPWENNYYHLIGSVYVHGLMGGEFFNRQWSSDPFPEQVILL